MREATRTGDFLEGPVPSGICSPQEALGLVFPACIDAMKTLSTVGFFTTFGSARGRGWCHEPRIIGCGGANGVLSAGRRREPDP